MNNCVNYSAWEEGPWQSPISDNTHYIKYNYKVTDFCLYARKGCLLRVGGEELAIYHKTRKNERDILIGTNGIDRNQENLPKVKAGLTWVAARGCVATQKTIKAFKTVIKKEEQLVEQVGILSEAVATLIIDRQFDKIIDFDAYKKEEQLVEQVENFSETVSIPIIEKQRGEMISLDAYDAYTELLPLSKDAYTEEQLVEQVEIISEIVSTIIIERQLGEYIGLDAYDVYKKEALIASNDKLRYIVETKSASNKDDLWTDPETKRVYTVFSGALIPFGHKQDPTKAEVERYKNACITQKHAYNAKKMVTKLFRQVQMLNKTLSKLDPNVQLTEVTIRNIRKIEAQILHLQAEIETVCAQAKICLENFEPDFVQEPRAWEFRPSLVDSRNLY